MAHHTEHRSDDGHIPVLLDEVIELLRPQPGEWVVDCTIGRAGHARAIMPRLAPGGRYSAIDADPDQIAALTPLASKSPVPLDLIHGRFGDVESLIDLADRRADGLLADLGFASTQIDDPDRGFSFTHDGPLDMRLDPTRGRSAADLLNDLPERELADLIYQLGEDRLSRKIARKISEARSREPINSTRQLAALCAAAYGHRGRRERIHPATRTFQALRIAVNDDLGQLERLLDTLPRIVAPGGRIVIISFHSLEDRMVKRAFNAFAAEDRAHRLTRKPITAADHERARNRRSRSAKARALRWLGP